MGTACEKAVAAFPAAAFVLKLDCGGLCGWRRAFRPPWPLEAPSESLAPAWPASESGTLLKNGRPVWGLCVLFWGCREPGTTPLDFLPLCPPRPVQGCFCTGLSGRREWGDFEKSQICQSIIPLSACLCCGPMGTQLCSPLPPPGVRDDVSAALCCGLLPASFPLRPPPTSVRGSQAQN